MSFDVAKTGKPLSFIHVQWSKVIKRGVYSEFDGKFFNILRNPIARSELQVSIHAELYWILSFMCLVLLHGNSTHEETISNPKFVRKK